MTKFNPVKVVIFDLDGTILDTESVYQTIFEDICKKFNKTLPLETRLKLLGTEERKSCGIVIKDCKLPCTVDEFYKEFQELSLRRISNCDVFPGLQKFIRHLHENAIPIAVGSGSSADSIALKIKNHQELFSLFHHIVTGTDPEVKAGKPAPDVFLITAKRFEKPVDPKDCLVIEDSPNGVKAAHAAGMQCVMVPDKHISKELQNEADLVLGSLTEIKPEDFGLPPF